jgi:L-cysteine:1D-myo-inositol 2-amino-2-deoxy-alpha-D-glucopyranoside ligase
MQLYDSARRGVFPLEVGPVASLYSCGITPYDSAHLGHAFVYLAFDVLTRRLVDLGHDARCVRNVTDVDDDLLRKARELGVNYLDLAAQEMVIFERDMKLINLLPVYSEPRATSAIPEILTLIGESFERGVAYEVDGSVYFEAAKFPRFGQVSHESPGAMVELAAIHGGRPAPQRDSQAGSSSSDGCQSTKSSGLRLLGSSGRPPWIAASSTMAPGLSWLT